MIFGNAAKECQLAYHIKFIIIGVVHEKYRSFCILGNHCSMRQASLLSFVSLDSHLCLTVCRLPFISVRINSGVIFLRVCCSTFMMELSGSVNASGSIWQWSCDLWGLMQACLFA